MDGSDIHTMTSFRPAPGTQRQFRDALGSFGTGVTVVTTRGPDGPCAITANSFASVSLDPPLVLWSVDEASDRSEIFATARHSAIHILAQDQVDLACHFARDGFDFNGIAWTGDENGTPRLQTCLTRFDCETSAVHPGGDHQILVLRVLRVQTAPGAPLLFSGGQFGQFSTA